jgi:pyruvate formate lyase activating enzyme
MVFGGIQKHSLIDYPGKLSCVLFLTGCNFHCPFCHNPELARGTTCAETNLNETGVIDFLKSRRDFLDAVVVSGGEPTLSKDLIPVCRRIKEMGYPIKLDTNGSRPRILEKLIHLGLVDYFAMDIKTDPLRYGLLARETGTPTQILTSIKLIMESGIDYEFRTTCMRPLINERAVTVIATIIQGAKRYVLQHFRPNHVLEPAFFEDLDPVIPEEELQRLRAVVEPFVEVCLVR